MDLAKLKLGRTFVHEPMLSSENVLHVLDYERASEVIETASAMAVGTCYCRHKMYHVGKACDTPMELCMTFNTKGASLIKHNIARKVVKKEGLDYLRQAYDHNLVQFGENVRENVNFICNSCGCCCEAMIAARKLAIMHPVHTTNFIPALNESNCSGCGKCVDVCPVEAMSLVSSNDPHKPKRKKTLLNEVTCLGCGLCVKVCSKNSLHLKSREKRIISPLNGTHKAVVMAIERGKLQHLIFDNQVLWRYRALAAVLGVILKLPPIKQMLANKRVKSRYLENLITKMDS